MLHYRATLKLLTVYELDAQLRRQSETDTPTMTEEDINGRLNDLIDEINAEESDPRFTREIGFCLPPLKLALGLEAGARG